MKLYKEFQYINRIKIKIIIVKNMKNKYIIKNNR